MRKSNASPTQTNTLTHTPQTPKIADTCMGLEKQVIGRNGVQKTISKNKITTEDIMIKELQKKFTNVSNSFQIDTSILTTILVGAREKSTTNNCLGYFNKWSNWTGQYPEISALPTKEAYIVVYLLNLYQTVISYSTICLTYQAMNYFHSIAGIPQLEIPNLT